MKICKNISKHPRLLDSSRKRKALIIGGTGATGRRVINQLLNSSDWTTVTSISRRSTLGDRITHPKLNDVVITSLHDMESVFDQFTGNDVFFNCIGTTRKKAGSASNFKAIEYGISNIAAKLASKAKIPHASVISASGANPNLWSHNLIHPLFYSKTMGLKEQTLIKNPFERVSIFRPGMLIRQINTPSRLEKLLEKSGFGLKVDLLASAMIRDSMCKDKGSSQTPIVYYGNKCINDSINL